MNDPLEGSRWSTAATVTGFAQSSPNARLLRFANDELTASGGHRRMLDLGCGAARNAVPLARLGWEVLGIDLSWAMLHTANERARAEQVAHRLHVVLAPMDVVPAADASFDLVVAHGIWNLARSDAEFRRALREAARVARPGAGLFVFTFSRNTLAPEAQPVPGEAFVHTQFSGQPQCFLTEEQLLSELHAVGFAPDPAVPLREHNRPASGGRLIATGPVVYEGAFRRQS